MKLSRIKIEEIFLSKDETFLIEKSKRFKKYRQKENPKINKYIDTLLKLKFHIFPIMQKYEKKKQ
jgi:hypothetical protein